VRKSEEKMVGRAHPTEDEENGGFQKIHPTEEKGMVWQAAPARER
jgi:hypothetical protein